VSAGSHSFLVASPKTLKGKKLSSVFYEKLIVVQLIKSLAFNGTGSFNALFTRARHLSMFSIVISTGFIPII
jgi:hypothetical protein